MTHVRDYRLFLFRFLTAGRPKFDPRSRLQTISISFLTACRPNFDPCKNLGTIAISFLFSPERQGGLFSNVVSVETISLLGCSSGGSSSSSKCSNSS